MMSDLESVRTQCRMSTIESQALVSAEAPILLLLRRETTTCATKIVDAVAPDNPYLGVLLPYTPLHHLLMAAVQRPIVCTSGNLSEEPMAISTEDALERLRPLSDLILTHDREIVRPVDDSVARDEGSRLQILRRARGYAPVPVRLQHPVPPMLAVGGHLKNTVAVSIGSEVVISPHIGDLDNTLSLEVHRRTIADLIDFFDLIPERIVCDLHPDYSSTRHAQHLASAWHVPLVAVQHHHAHILSAMAEWHLDGPVLGLAWDGTGYGTDGTVWGGEAIVVDGRTWQRLAHLRTFLLPGGDRVAREPRRAALALLHAIGSPDTNSLAEQWFSDAEVRTLRAALDRPGLFPRCSSMGRLFDAVAALCGLRDRVSFEGQAAMQLEYAADRSAVAPYPLAIHDQTPAIVDWQPLLEHVLADLAAGVSIGCIAGRFHGALAELAVSLARRADCPTVVLSGGCFQNHLLAQRARASLSEAGFDVYTQRLVPPGDGGLSLGQILGAALQAEE
jgi:hydrogenase maturation protein HypF